MDLQGLKINFLGDSITEGVGASDRANTCFVAQIAKQTGAICRNYGIGGTRIARQTNLSQNPVHDLDFCGRVEDMDPDADVVVVFGGTNDFGHGDAPLGKMSDRTVWSFYGALHVLYDSLLKRYPKAKIVILTPMKRREQERNGRVLINFVEAIREVVATYGFYLLDIYKDLPVDIHDPAMQAKYTTDGLHPNDAGYVVLAETIADFLSKL